MTTTLDSPSMKPLILVLRHQPLQVNITPICPQTLSIPQILRLHVLLTFGSGYLLYLVSYSCIFWTRFPRSPLNRIPEAPMQTSTLFPTCQLHRLHHLLSDPFPRHLAFAYMPQLMELLWVHPLPPHPQPPFH